MRTKSQEHVIEGLAALLGGHAAHQDHLRMGEDKPVPLPGAPSAAGETRVPQAGVEPAAGPGIGGKPSEAALDNRDQFSCHTLPLEGEE